MSGLEFFDRTFKALSGLAGRSRVQEWIQVFNILVIAIGIGYPFVQGAANLVIEWKNRGIIAAAVEAGGPAATANAELIPKWKSLLDPDGFAASVYWPVFAGLLVMQLVGLYRKSDDWMNATRFAFIDDEEDVYRGFIRAIRSAKSVIRTTHIRTTPLHNVGTHLGRTFQDEIHDWIAKDRDRWLKRLIADNSGLLKHVIPMLVLKECFPRYTMYGTKWELAVPAINLAIFDESEVFVCVYDRTEGVQHDAPMISAIHSRDEKCVRKWIAYFEALAADPAMSCFDDRQKSLVEMVQRTYAGADESTVAEIWKEADRAIARIGRKVGPVCRDAFPRVQSPAASPQRSSADGKAAGGKGTAGKSAVGKAAAGKGKPGPAAGGNAKKKASGRNGGGDSP